MTKRERQAREKAALRELKVIHATFSVARQAGQWTSSHPQHAWSRLLECRVREQSSLYARP